MSQWECQHCTLLNPVKRVMCSACRKRRGRDSRLVGTDKGSDANSSPRQQVAASSQQQQRSQSGDTKRAPPEGSAESNIDTHNSAPDRATSPTQSDASAPHRRKLFATQQTSAGESEVRRSASRRSASPPSGRPLPPPDGGLVLEFASGRRARPSAAALARAKRLLNDMDTDDDPRGGDPPAAGAPPKSARPERPDAAAAGAASQEPPTSAGFVLEFASGRREEATVAESLNHEGLSLAFENQGFEIKASFCSIFKIYQII